MLQIQKTRHTSVAAGRLKEGTAVSSSHDFINPKLESVHDPVPRQLDPDDFLFGESTKLKRVHSETEMEQLRVLNADSVDRLEARFENLLFRSGKWRVDRSPTSGAASLEETLRAQWEQKKSYLFSDVYRLVFEKHVSSSLVFLGLRKALEKRCFFSEFSDALSDPLTLTVTSVMEYAKYNERQANRRSGSSESKS